MINGLTFDRKITEKEGFRKCSKVFFAGESELKSEKTEFFRFVNSSYSGDIKGNIYIDSLLEISDDILDKVIDNYYSDKNSKLIINISNSLDEVGTCDKKYGYSPVFYAEKLGLLSERTFLSGCIYVDAEDTDLINQTGAYVILLPSHSMGNGCGIPPVRMLMSLNAKVILGTGDGEYNKNGDPAYEAEVLQLAASGVMKEKNILEKNEINLMLTREIV